MATVNFNSGTHQQWGSHLAMGTAGVTALESPQSSQTKNEIRKLVAEIAALSSSQVELNVFLSDVLPLICTAMGATSAAIWTVACDGSPTLLSAHNLPTELATSPRGLPNAKPDVSSQPAQLDLNSTDSATSPPSVDHSPVVAAHLRVLTVAINEGEPVSVPPNSVRLNTERPANPLQEALFIVPIRIEQRVDILVEVIQPPSGGPAAQRGYLRFVAQMADLIADFLRRQRLQQLSHEAQRVRQLQQFITRTGAAPTSIARWHGAANSIARWLDAGMVLLLTKQGRRWRVRGCSELAQFDPRSEIVTRAERVLAEFEVDESQDPQALHILAAADSEPPFAPAAISPRATPIRSGNCAEELRRALDTKTLLRVPLVSGQCEALLACDQPVDVLSLTLQAQQLLPTLAAQLTSNNSTYARLPGLWQLLPFPPAMFDRVKPAAHGFPRRIAFAVACSALAMAVALFPIPDQINVVAVLEATDKQMYYAPASGMIEQVMVDSDQPVQAGQLLLQLVDKTLEARLDELIGKRASTANQLDQDRGALVRGSQLNASQRDELENRIEQLKIQLVALDEQVSVLRSQAQALGVVARCDASVTSWDVRNRLEGRPVAAGQLLLVTCAPQSNWQLQLSIPERKVGLVQAAMQHSGGRVPVQFSLSSHPNEVRQGTLVSLSKQLLKDEIGDPRVLGTVELAGHGLPAKTDGAIARAAIDCGTSPAVWLIARDAYREASAWIRMFW